MLLLGVYDTVSSLLPGWQGSEISMWAAVALPRSGLVQQGPATDCQKCHLNFWRNYAPLFQSLWATLAE
ncbi:hypothetical protein KY46_11675 [Photobacterium halotolerans]|uniref:Uncharacterized protein n=1 Tax=Photobacterium halotolerans TaxID=265726 RepID=A0A0F5VBZ5_9GAMM|nr:hypothetical protein KY46_11675 [Photobacterium halotolerans]